MTRPGVESWGGHSPTVPDSAWVHPSAVVMGDVTLGERVTIWPTVVLRGDQGAIVIGDETNVQDGTVAHATGGISTVQIGARCTIGHRVILHGCVVEDDCLIGMGSVVMNHARIGAHCLVGANTLIPEGKTFPDGVLILGSPGKVVRELTADERARLAHTADKYVEYSKRYATQLTRIA